MPSLEIAGEIRSIDEVRADQFKLSRLSQPRPAAGRGGGMIVSFLVAMDRNLVIGDEGNSVALPADLKRSAV